ncbi:type I-C CRISPR-associated protein Cas8c/Csd1 [Tetragenococcus koreensis]|uniref:CRISPR-associated protein Csd1 n=1 Tax=Tetragenococcus koreensis TaxID=290335 RepID=A0AAN4UBJ0_9ENTE|nr:type I-C CRISPR-associated protein Cas8c/Csd1 [Tetragenococcus koreensis]MCF1617507.1 type I-C CRISPR-associated protein Cas8c/Csd1 [Tetragenococcus koreensis]MCF1622266.1 type I-C CRISPR-associated protein Cas8c/Csd1 [Tetragenococcus koreensis]MCF1632711.1 type I-C CRISPR-associated protein Cas8c/Csd1 [Tetragenococcus koreensis]MCF1678482.1 type I-C CRISPR-associated protein Cas8c/Csd1 [Tetragenococcus koreensis]MCF1679845.1 type I-C CRISPR-associated protein Cas8c/Csd1 [Tetragenococcus ko
MDFLTALLQAYDTSTEQGLVDKQEGNNTILLPLYHTNMKSRGNDIIQIYLTKQGKLSQAEFLPEKEMTIFPVTSDSIARSGKNPPSHPLVDKISYIAAEDKDLHQLYLNEFNRWYQEVTDTKVKEFLTIIKQFVSKEYFLDEILDKLYGKENYTRNQLEVHYTEGKKSKKADLTKVFLTFAINDFSGYQTISVTNFVKLHENYIRYVEAQDSPRGICNISGEEQQLTTKHRGLLGNAKLVSVSNNKETYQGRFKNGTDIIQIGYKTSEKVHLMLKYLLENQNSRRWLGGQQYLVNWFSDDIANDSQFDISVPSIVPFPTNQSTKPKVVSLANKEVGRSFILGEQKFSKDANYYAAIIDKASNGRISLKFFRDLQASQLLRNLQKWQIRYSWERYSVQDEKIHPTTPSLWQFLQTAYGVERNGRLEVDNDNFKKDQFQKLVVSLIDGRLLPANISTALKANIRKRMNYEKTWLQIQFTTLAVFSHKNGEEQLPVLDRENTDRSYLYGRLLAVLDRTEGATYNRSEPDKQRVTNAQKFWTSYTNHPAKTMQTLIEKTKSYEKALRSANPGLLFKLNKEKQEIINILNDHYLNSADINKALDFHFIFGYYAETQFLFTKTESEEVENVNE